ncbi:FCD domain-containing protein [Streptomyces sp. NBC_01433]|uniref:FadR/GntR family transcriptional regulator n=1 Tax=Streptomyces sp. NBC_01433 TaxID=2903864 RepID=UPI00225B2528|nr:FCD domain-containing protein [Streptomyces sp. NBC_01433]MCX4679443.1 FCD domain-containing protein [Streptomyces sp. NBC_01433]
MTGARGPGATRAATAAEQVTELVGEAQAGERLGTKEELRTLCGVSVGTFNETLRLLQSRGIVTVRPGPGGGIFVAEQSPMARLGNSVLALDANPDSVSEAIRIRDALDPLLIEDALWHASPAELAALHGPLSTMERAAGDGDPVAFVHANWELHRKIAGVSPNHLLREIYRSLLDLIESHTLTVLPAGDQPLDEYIGQRYQLHADLIAALERRDRAEALRLIGDHGTSPAGRH